MHFLPQSQGERLLASTLLAVALHLIVYLLLDGLPPASQSQLGLSVRLASPPAPAHAVAQDVQRLVEAAPALPVPVQDAANPEQASEAMPARPLALARYYPANELDTLAEPLQPILLPDLEDELPPDTILDVYIDYQGVVQRVVLPEGLDANFAAQVMQRFQTARFSPALKDGMPVNSFKRIVLQPEDL